MFLLNISSVICLAFRTAVICLDAVGLIARRFYFSAADH